MLKDRVHFMMPMNTVWAETIVLGTISIFFFLNVVPDTTSKLSSSKVRDARLQFYREKGCRQHFFYPRRLAPTCCVPTHACSALTTLTRWYCVRGKNLKNPDRIIIQALIFSGLFWHDRVWFVRFFVRVGYRISMCRYIAYRCIDIPGIAYRYIDM